jgi:predicted enzyme related to lactoylglutathione lyase
MPTRSIVREASMKMCLTGFSSPGGRRIFYLIRTEPENDRGLQGALQERQRKLDGAGMRGFECTIGVDDLDTVLALITCFGGTVVSKPFAIDGVGRLAYFHETEGNRVGVMQYDAAYVP